MIRRKLFVLVSTVLVLLCVMAPADQKVLFRKQSAYNTVIVTEDDRGLRTLWFEEDGARQSVVKPGEPDRLELPYAQVMPIGLAFVARPRRVLVVGLGGGTIPAFLRKHYPELAIDVVEIDPEVVYAAKHFFGFREDRRMHVYIDDGRRFIETCPNRYDVIFLDAYGADNVPYSLSTCEFLQAVCRALSPKGVAVGNVWSRASNSLYDSMIRTYRAVFQELYVLDVRARGNKILVAVPRDMPISRDELARAAEKLSVERSFPFDMGKLVEYGFRQPGPPPPDARVLRDQDQPRQDDSSSSP